MLAFLDLAEDPVVVGCEGVAWDRDNLLLFFSEKMNKLSLDKIWFMETRRDQIFAMVFA